jgi:hypothetical protein
MHDLLAAFLLAPVVLPGGAVLVTALFVTGWAIINLFLAAGLCVASIEP